MALSFIHGIAVGIIFTFIALFTKFYRLTPFVSYSTNNITNRTSDLRHVTNISYEGYQFFVFSHESPMVRAYLDVVRDTVCGLTLRTRERAYSSDSQARPMDIGQRIKGLDWPLTGITMVGQRRLINIEWAIRFVIANDVMGDFIECGVWRGGSSVFARAILKALDNNDRHVWLADSFQGLPKARTTNDNDNWSKMEYLKVSLEEVQTNFRSFNLLDDRVHFCKGYFVDSLPRCNVSRIAVFRMDGDMYESTMDQLFNLYSKLQIGGVIIIDDYTISDCFRAIVDFRKWHNITEEILSIPGDVAGRCWIKRKSIQLQMEQYLRLLPTTKSESEY
ncbi:unnamed protein product [Rotaria socialis]|uniref:Macrocin O-methyltransferase n=1 Tax=Rotaria socialis TaxID=392032 RepID=A0A818J7B0_9BILA|nr:unnamed protein product [Rotaria socialis]CAF4884700.1 unnamed protein product [Rotaria socialis]